MPSLWIGPNLELFVFFSFQFDIKGAADVGTISGRVCLSHPLSGVQYPLLPKVTLIACSLSGKTWRTEAFVKTLQTSSCQDGEKEQRNVNTPTLRSGLNIVMRRVKIPFVPLQTN